MRAYDLPGLTEIAAWGFECEARSGLTHVHEDYVYPEVLDEQERPVKPGERGELVFTSLYRKAMPLLRYRTRDIVQRADRRCPCGRTLVAFDGGVLARVDDMKQVRGSSCTRGGSRSWCGRTATSTSSRSSSGASTGLTTSSFGSIPRRRSPSTRAAV